jgi:glycosyltransferase involved in cell wall biosynthesis
MRVLYFTAGDSPHDRRFLDALAGSAHQVFALRQFAPTPQTPPDIRELSWSYGMPDFSNWQGWQDAAKQLRTLLNDQNIDLVHAGPIQGPAFLTAWCGFHPLAAMSWGSDLLRKAHRSPWMRYATRTALANTDVFLGDCEAVANEAAAFGFSRNRMVIFPWGVDLQHFSPQKGHDAGQALRSQLGWRDNFVILCNRTWAPLYGVDVLAQAFVRAVRQNPDLRLLLVGDGPWSAYLHNILSPVEDCVHYPGWLAYADLPGVYGAADLFISPSHSDGSSISLLEAMACACPVLVSDIPGNREWVDPGETGELFPDGDVSALQKKILTLAEDSLRLARWGQAARDVAVQRANWSANFQKCLSAYEMAADLRR